MTSLESIHASLVEGQKLLSDFLSDPDQLRRCDVLSQMIVELYSRKGNLFLCGNGGSHCDSMHFAEEFTGRFRKNREALGALALGDASHLTCVSNDFGFEHVFERQVEGLGRAGDMLIGITTSGNSKNIALAIEKARSKGMRTACLLGRDGGWMKGMSDLDIIVPGKTSDRVQEMHIKIIHSVIEAAERKLYPDHYLPGMKSSLRPSSEIVGNA